jgi:hypothetical protein
LRLASSREAAVQHSTHKKIVVAGFGCAGVLIGLIVLALLLTPHSEYDRPRDAALYTPAQAAAARESLDVLPVRFAAPRAPPALGTEVTLWRAALVVMRAESPRAGLRPLPYGDSFPLGSAEHTEWMAAADWRAVRVLLEREAAHVTPEDTVGSLSRMDANMVLSVTRALHARARAALNAPQRVAAAAHAERVALAIGRGLEGEPDLEHVMLGARVMCDGWRFLTAAPALARRIGTPDPSRALLQADSDLAELRTVHRLMVRVGSQADNAPALGAWVRDTAVSIAVRREAVRAIAYGWVFNTREPLYGLGRARARTLDALPDPVAAAVRDGQAVQRLGVAQRFARSVDYRATRDAAAGL